MMFFIRLPSAGDKKNILSLYNVSLIVMNKWLHTINVGTHAYILAKLMWVIIQEEHDDVIKWKNPAYWPFVTGIHQSPVDSPHKSQWCGALIIFWSAHEQTAEQMIGTLVIWNAIALIMASL